MKRNAFPGCSCIARRAVALLFAPLLPVSAGAAPKIQAQQPPGVPMGIAAVFGPDAYSIMRPPPDLRGVKAVSVGGAFALALRYDGTVVAWGEGGYGSTDVPPGLSGVVAVAAGGRHAAALKSDGTVVSWGFDGHPQNAVPAGLSGVTALAAGFYHTLALKSDGTVTAWGDGLFGITPPAGLSGVTAIAAGDYHSMARKSDGTVVTWGSDNYGQVTVPTGLSGVTAIAAGAKHSLALKTEGTVVAWGSNQNLERTVPSGLSGVTGLTAGNGLSAALKDNGKCVVWGNNFVNRSSIPAVVTLQSLSGTSSYIGGLQRGVDFGDQRIAFPSPPQTITLANTGDVPLIPGTLTLEGDLAAEFTLHTAGLAGSVPPGGSTSFEVTFTPAAAGPRDAAVRVASNDPNQGSLEIGLHGLGFFDREIQVTGNGHEIVSGTRASRTEDGTLFGNVSALGGTEVHSFTIVNSGADPLHIDYLSAPGIGNAFTVLTSPEVVAGNSSTTFQIEFAPSRAGDYVGWFTLKSDDWDESEYTFDLQGSAFAGMPAVGSPEAVDTGITTVTLRAAVTSDGGGNIEARGMVLSPTAVNSDPLPGGAGVQKFNAGAGTGVYSFPLRNLSAATEFTFKAFVTNSAGTVYSAPVRFTTLPPVLPVLSSVLVEELTFTGAWFHARVNDDSGAPITAFGAVYAPAATNSDPVRGGPGVVDLPDRFGIGVMSEYLTGLTPGTAYVLKAYATNSVGTVYSSPVSFTTLTPGVPLLGPAVSGGITPLTATLGGEVASENGLPVTARGVVYALTSVNASPVIGGPGVTQVSASGSQSATFSAAVDGLTASKNYSFKAWAANSAGTGYSTTATFTTLPPSFPIVISPGLTGIGNTAATPGGNVLSDSGAAITERGVVISAVSVNANPFRGGAGVTQIPAAGTAGAFTVNAGGLTPGTTYAFKAWAASGIGTGYTEARVFTTSGGPDAQITVTTVLDENDTPAGPSISLREAVRDAAGGATIDFVPGLDGRALVLERGEIPVNGKTIHIDASRLVRGIVLDGGKKSRHFNVASGASLALTKLTLQNGKPSDLAGVSQPGGSLLGAGPLTLTDCTLRDNEAGSGANGAPGTGAADGATPGRGGNGTRGNSGGAVSTTAALTAVRCRFLFNHAGNGGSGGAGGSSPDSATASGACGGTGSDAGDGGAIASSGGLTLTDCLFEANKAGAGGNGGSVGGGGNVGGPVNLCQDSSASGAGRSGSGGAVFNVGSLTAAGCVFMGNGCWTGGFGGNLNAQGGVHGVGGQAGSGGAIHTGGGAALLVNCTLSGNKVEDGFFTGGNGGAICGASSAGTSLRLVHCTLTGNRADFTRLGVPDWRAGNGGGVSSGGPAQFDNCLLAGNRVVLGNSFPLDVREENTAGSGARTFTPATPFPDYLSSLPAVDPRLSLLLVSGGAAPGHLLNAGSPALHAGVAVAGAPPVDQRGLPRPVNAPDLGAVEAQGGNEPGTLPPQSINFNPPLTFDYEGAPGNLVLSAVTTTGLTAVLELMSGPATLNGNSLTVTGTGTLVVRASHPGNERWAAAADVTRVIRADFVPAPGDTDGDGVENRVEAALQLDPFTPNAPPLVVQSRADGTVHAVLARRPRGGTLWRVDIEISYDLENWTPAPPGATTVTPVPGGEFDSVDVRLLDFFRQYSRLKATRLF